MLHDAAFGSERLQKIALALLQATQSFFLLEKSMWRKLKPRERLLT